MPTTRAEVLQALWALVPIDVTEDQRIQVNPTQLAAMVDCTAEEAGQWLTALGCGRTRIRLPSGQRVYQRTFRVGSLSPVPPVDRQSTETPSAEARLPDRTAGPMVILKSGPQIDTHCTRCGEPLPGYMRALGICGDCLTASQQAVRSVPGPRYGCVEAIRGEGPADALNVPGPGYSTRER